MKKIFCIDDNGQGFEKLGMLLNERGFSVTEIADDAIAPKSASSHSEQSYLDLFENAPIGIFRSTLEGKFITVNPAVARMLKYDSPEEMIRLVNRSGIAEAVYLEPAHRREVLEDVLSHNGWRIHAELFRCKDGTVVTCNFHLRANFEGGVFTGLDGFVEDITERKLAEESLLLSQFIIDHASLGIFRGSSDARILSVNEHWAKVLGYSAEELCSMSFFDIDPNLTEESWSAHRRKLTETGLRTFESTHRRKDGTIFPVEITVNYHRYGDQEFSCSFAQDITRRKKAEEELCLAKLIVENSLAVLFRWRAADGWPVDMVSGSIARFGYTPEEFLSGAVPFSSIIFHEDQERVAAEVREYSAAGLENFQQEYRIVTRQGDVRWIDDRTMVERDDEGRITHYQGLVLDITDRKRIEQQLYFTQYAIDHTIDQAFWMTGDARLFYVNDAACRALGYSRQELEGMSIPDIGPTFPAEVFAEYWCDLREKGSLTFESLHRAKDGRVYPVEIRANYVVFDGKEYNCAFATDISERKFAEKSLRISEQKYRDIVDHAPFGICRSTIEGKLVSVNPALAGILKYDSPDELLEKVNCSSIQEVLLVEPQERRQVVSRIFEGPAWHVFDCRYRCKDGSVITCKVHSRRILEQGGCEREFESFLENITDRVEAEKALRESEEKFRVLAETAPAAIVVYQGGNIVYANPAAERLFGYGESELLRMNFCDWAHPDGRAQVMDRGLARQRGEPVPVQYEQSFVNKNGDVGWVIVSAGSITYRGNPAGIATFIDISENKRAEEGLQAALAEKVVLLKEVHHRVKNNLQIVSSLLELQSDYSSEGDDSRRFIRESQDRIRSMALIHEQLYKSEDLSMIDFACYVDELVLSLYRSAVVDQDKIRTDLEIRDIELGIDEAIPCGLIINELVSNSLEHGFPGDRRGSILIRGSMENEGCICLEVIDTGIGMPQGFDISTSESLGLQIVSLLTKQLHGTLDIQGEDGMAVRIRFKSKGGK